MTWAEGKMRNARRTWGRNRPPPIRSPTSVLISPPVLGPIVLIIFLSIFLYILIFSISQLILQLDSFPLRNTSTHWPIGTTWPRHQPQQSPHSPRCWLRRWLIIPALPLRGHGNCLTYDCLRSCVQSTRRLLVRTMNWFLDAHNWRIQSYSSKKVLKILSTQ